MKKHILNKYRTGNIDNTLNVAGPTILTETLEDSDTDEFVLIGPTYITKSVEESDADEFLLNGPTNLTFTQEETDVDEFVMENNGGNKIFDFDEFLCF